MAFVLTAGQTADGPRFVGVLKKVRIRLPVGRPRTRPAAVAADKAHSSRANRSYPRKRHIKAVIPEKRDQAANRKNKGSRGGRPVSHGAGLYRERNTVERLINKLKAWRGIATRYDKSPESHLAGLHLRDEPGRRAGNPQLNDRVNGYFAPRSSGPYIRMTAVQAKSVGGHAEPAGEVVVQVLLIVADPGDVTVGA